MCPQMWRSGVWGPQMCFFGGGFGPEPFGGGGGEEWSGEGSRGEEVRPLGVIEMEDAAGDRLCDFE